MALPLTGDRKDWKALAQPFLANAARGLRELSESHKSRLQALRSSEVVARKNRSHILVCGWRPEWDG
jgi:hypothetical protein